MRSETLYIEAKLIMYDAIRPLLPYGLQTTGFPLFVGPFSIEAFAKFAGVAHDCAVTDGERVFAYYSLSKPRSSHP